MLNSKVIVSRAACLVRGWWVGAPYTSLHDQPDCRLRTGIASRTERSGDG